MVELHHCRMTSIIRINRPEILSVTKMCKHDSQQDETRAQVEEMTGDDFMEKLRKSLKMLPYDVLLHLSS